jgi:Phosphatidylglycerol lysyltransferase, C-terminal
MRPAEDRARALELIDRFGTNPMSFLVRYDAPWRFHFGRSAEGVVCYQESNGYAMAWCDPVCAPADRPALLLEFTRETRARGLRVCWMAIDGPTAELARANGYAVLKVGEDPCFDLATWSMPRGDPGKRLRWSLNRARRAGLRVRQYRPAEGRDAELESRIRAVEAAWAKALGRPVVRSFIRPATFDEANLKRIFVAEDRNGSVAAFVSCAPVPARDGWYLEDLVRAPDAPAGATELVVTEALQALAAEGARFATLGIAPLRGFDHQIDPRARWLARALRLGFDHLDARFHFVSLSRYRSKFRPTSWEPRSAAFLPRRPGVRLARAALEVLDPTPPEAAPAAPRGRARARVLVAVQAVVWLVAGLAVVAGGRIARLDDPSAAAAYLAPAGVAGALLALLLGLTWQRMERREGVVYRGLLVVLEAVLAIAALDRLVHRQGPVVDVASLVLVGSVLALLLRSRRAADAAAVDPYEETFRRS